MEDMKKTAGENLKKIAKLKGIQNKQIAAYMDVSTSSVSHWFKGDNFLDIQNLYKLCLYLGVTLDQVFGLAPIVLSFLNQDEEKVLLAYRAAGSETQAAVRRVLSVPEPKKDTSSKAK